MAEWLEQANVSCAIVYMSMYMSRDSMFMCGMWRCIHIYNYGSGFHVSLKNVNVMISNVVGKPSMSGTGYLQTSVI